MEGSRLTLGASYLGEGRTRFRVWAPDRSTVEVRLEGSGGGRLLPLERRPGGYFEGTHPVEPGARYRYRLSGGDSFPDPCSRFQPEGPHGPSEVVDPGRFRWSDRDWRGLSLKGQVLYELHVGAFSPEGNYAGVKARLPFIKELGITTIELMPVNTFPGRFNWGYDGVALFAPCAVYGGPDDLRSLVDEAHRLGLGVILDVVYNHLGPDGNYLGQYARAYFTDRYPAEWGTPLNFDGEHAGPVRDFFAQNAAYWISEFHFDGLRMDATQNIYDASGRHVVAEIAQAARAAAAGRDLLLIAENEPQDMAFVTEPARGGLGVDAIWVDDFHHSARVAVTGNRGAYLRDYRGTAQELLSCALRNSLYQGQWYAFLGKPRGTPLYQAPPERVVFYLQNHDQISNSLRGERLHVPAGGSRMRALTTYLLLLPQTPLLFMGQEFFSSSPFLFFADHNPDLQEKVNQGRAGYLARFPEARHALQRESHQLPSGEEAFRRSRLDPRERARNAEALALHRALLRLRREDPVLGAQDPDRLLGALLGPAALVLRYLGGREQGDRLLLLNLDAERVLDPCPEPLLAPPPGTCWQPVLSSEESRFGGLGALYPTGEGVWTLPGQCALVLTSRKT